MDLQWRSTVVSELVDDGGSGVGRSILMYSCGIDGGRPKVMLRVRSRRMQPYQTRFRNSLSTGVKAAEAF